MIPAIVMLISKTPAVPLISFRSDSTTTNNQHINRQPHNAHRTTSCYHDEAAVVNVRRQHRAEGPCFDAAATGREACCYITMTNMTGPTNAGPKTKAAFMKYFARLDKGNTTKMENNAMKRVLREGRVDDELERKIAKKVKQAAA